MKKFFKSMLVVSVFGLSLTAANAAFPDVDSSHPNFDAIDFVQQEQIVKGFTDGTYGADRTITRAEFTNIVISTLFEEAQYDSNSNGRCTIVHNISESNLVFPDVSMDNVHIEYICLAKISNILGGFSDGNFYADNNITIGESAKIISNAYNFTNEQGSGDDPFKPFVDALATRNAIPETASNLDSNLLRGEMAEYIYRLENSITNKSSRTYTELKSSNSEPIASDFDYTSVININDDCGHNLDPAIVNYGYNLILDGSGNIIQAQGKPIQEDYYLITSESYIEDANTREYARIFSYMAPVRDALICDLDTVDSDSWQTMTEIFDLNGIKTTQDLSGNKQEQFYSTDGIYEYLTTDGPDFNPMMKYLEESELELKCLAFQNFDFTNPEGDNHCDIYGFVEGSGIVFP